MHAIKGGWVGQTFALAKSNESEGKKTRIRRSKEERKAMVESFIKKYQSSNNGSFPSLNLTHKEVGGSFYTVREIVREIIQENRVLGPANFTSEELNTTDEQYPLGSISMEPQTALHVTSNGSHFVSNNYQVSSEKSDPISDGIFSESANENQRLEYKKIVNGNNYQVSSEKPDPISDGLFSEPANENQRLESKQIIDGNNYQVSSEKPDPTSDGLLSEPANENQRLESEQIINGSQENGRTKEGLEQNLKIEESSEQACDNMQTSQQSIAYKGDEELENPTNKIIDFADLEVETFPLRLAPEVVRSETEILEGNEIEKLGLDLATGNVRLDNVTSVGNSGFIDEKNEETDSTQLLDGCSGLVDKEVVDNVVGQQLENINDSITYRGTLHSTPVVPDVEVEVSQSNVLTSQVHMQKQRIDGAKAINAPNGKIASGIPRSSSSSVNSRTPEANMSEKKVDVQHKGLSEGESNPTLDRINLESWEGASRNPAERKTNPLWTVFRSFVTAFVKFWTE